MHEGSDEPCDYFCPPWKVGDVLWVRESAWYDDAFGGRAFFEDGHCLVKGEGVANVVPHPCSREMFKACGLQKFRPSIHMPRWASRINLRVTDVRVERVQQISCGGYMAPSDVQKEGCPFENDPAKMGMDEIEWFKTLWDSINAKRGLGWAENPWVVVTEFEKI